MTEGLELKTLKDLKAINGVVDKVELRQKAIKWIKDLKKCYRDDGFECPTLNNEIYPECVKELKIDAWCPDGFYSNEVISHLINLIKHLFNLTEEDLK